MHMASTLILRKTYAKATKRGFTLQTKKQRAESKIISGGDNGRILNLLELSTLILNKTK